ncbi:unnamed protein product [Gemmata obscuriglobus UQM 2246]|nr:unnamed protein product [Gemmata obscuriglobus UQM 2246]
MHATAPGSSESDTHDGFMYEGDAHRTLLHIVGKW